MVVKLSKPFVLLMIVVSLLQGCASVPPPREISVGDNPKESDMDATEREFARFMLNALRNRYNPYADGPWDKEMNDLDDMSFFKTVLRDDESQLIMIYKEDLGIDGGLQFFYVSVRLQGSLDPAHVFRWTAHPWSPHPSYSVVSPNLEVCYGNADDLDKISRGSFPYEEQWYNGSRVGISMLSCFGRGSGTPAYLDRAPRAVRYADVDGVIFDKWSEGDAFVTFDTKGQVRKFILLTKTLLEEK